MNENKTDDAKNILKGALTEPMCRRTFLARLSIALGAICGALMTLPGIGFVLAPLFRKTPSIWRGVGQVEDFKIGETVNVTFLDSSPLKWAGITARTAAWLRRLDATNFVAFAVNCSHLGCPVRWMRDANLFMCPCHGGVYYNDGRVAAGPPPQPLTRYEVRVHDGEVQIQAQGIPIV
jgi:menaquinol-cytochrome c reductase iron-sulfur subunit